MLKVVQKENRGQKMEKYEELLKEARKEHDIEYDVIFPLLLEKEE